MRQQRYYRRAIPWTMTSAVLVQVPTTPRSFRPSPTILPRARDGEPDAHYGGQHGDEADGNVPDGNEVKYDYIPPDVERETQRKGRGRHA
jgi:hypothetical protein